MQNTTNSSNKLYTEEIEHRTSSDPIYPPSAKFYRDYSTGSSVSLDTVENNNHSAEGSSNTPKLSDQDKPKKSTEDKKKPTLMERFKNFLILMRPTAEMIFFDVALPLALYYILKIWLSTLIALILSGIPPLLRVIYLFWKRRTIDIIGCIFVVSFILSAVLSIISGDERLALLKDSTTTAIISVMFLFTLIPIRTKWFTVRPLVFLFAQQMMAASPPMEWTDIEGEKHDMPMMEWIWTHCIIFRKYCYILTALWGVILMGEFVAKVIMIKSTLTVDQIVLYGNIIVIVVVVVMTTGSMYGSRVVKKRGIVIWNDWKEKNDFTERFAD